MTTETTPSHKTRTPHDRAAKQRGSALFFVLLGVILFAALSFVVARSMRSQSTKIMTDRQVEIMASDILSYAQNVQIAVNRLRQKGVSEGEICFYHPDWGHVTYNGCSSETEKQVFHLQGGGAKFIKMHPDWIDPSIANTYGEYGLIMYTGHDAVQGIGTDGNSADNQELLMAFPYVRPEICTYINKSLGLPYNPVPTDITGFHPAGGVKRFTGSFNNGGNSSLYASATPDMQGKTSGCLRRADYYVFYAVLIAR